MQPAAAGAERGRPGRARGSGGRPGGLEQRQHGRGVEVLAPPVSEGKGRGEGRPEGRKGAYITQQGRPGIPPTPSLRASCNAPPH
ncbi:hypothetical protein NDU88_002050 [Pleurodeles waltl]|uniref:Uncharacterized protein n=1 Tax=Pleurodeles waltl TaxID=8319 RepID=A0AAV7MLJ9_PLEWA|nr:hypothetical protein NDU88_002050 [Pleurodeles waltl]